MHFGSTSDPWGPGGKAKLRSMHYNIGRGEAELRILKLTSVLHHLPSVGPKQLCALSHLGCTSQANASYFLIKRDNFFLFKI